MLRVMFAVLGAILLWNAVAALNGSPAPLVSLEYSELRPLWGADADRPWIIGGFFVAAIGCFYFALSGVLRRREERRASPN